MTRETIPKELLKRVREIEARLNVTPMNLDDKGNFDILLQAACMKILGEEVDATSVINEIIEYSRYCPSEVQNEIVFLSTAGSSSWQTVDLLLDYIEGMVDLNDATTK